MQLRAIQKGDIVRVDKRGRLFLAFVLDKEARQLSIKPISRESYTTARAHEIVGHWAMRHRTRPGEEGR